MKLKRGLACLLAVAVLVALALTRLTPSAQATEGPELSLSSAAGTAGGAVTLTLNIQNNPGLSSILVYLYFDTSVFSADPSADLNAAGAFQAAGSMVTNSIATAKENDRYYGDQEKDGVLALWYSSASLDTDGNVLTLTLHVSDSADQGSYAVEVDYSQRDTCDEQGRSVSLQTTAGTVTVSADASHGQQAQLPTDEITKFSDTAGHWAEWYIDQAAQQGLVVGCEGLYHPDDTMTRAEFVTVLWRASGCPAPAGEASFTDLTSTWYQEAIAWAEENGMVNGVGDHRFEPDGDITREQAAAVLHRMAGLPTGMEATFSSIYDSLYADSSQVGEWSKSALYWAIYHDIYCGETGTDVGDSLSPNAAATRAQIAVMIVNYLEQL